ncbi:protein of unknown function DUF131 [Pyrolobus fumarii 1A]|uniref:DUF131 domain-containing protein n=1 Tax=Pyrolobus fumarii (strain DSM 11204 / 1A) TaxID=694429 RepID=G0EHR4_PYRF1|nr:protein of unknown function DUF131 [Pyrolobus fumarii 1A]
MSVASPEQVEVFNPWGSTLVTLGFLLIFLGVALVMIGFLLNIWSFGQQRVEGGRTEGGAVIIIGPFPIILASSERVAKTLLLLSIVLVILLIVLFFALPMLLRRVATPG